VSGRDGQTAYLTDAENVSYEFRKAKTWQVWSIIDKGPSKLSFKAKNYSSMKLCTSVAVPWNQKKEAFLPAVI